VNRHLLAPPRSLRAERESVLAVVKRVGSLQFDPLEIAGRNHDLVLLARVAGYRREWTEHWLYEDRRLYETYNKGLSIVPTAEMPWYRLTWERNHARLSGEGEAFDVNAPLVEELLTRIRDGGPLLARDVAPREAIDWYWRRTNQVRAILEGLAQAGILGISRREGNLRVYDLVERLFPADLLATQVPEHEQRLHRMLSRYRGGGLIGTSGQQELWVGTYRQAGEKAELRAELVAQGALEVTLLGQNVNSYGSDLGDRGAFAKLLRACADIVGLERVRFTSPHPRDFTDDVIEAMAETDNVMPSLHMPLQSGSDAVLRAMRRAYRAERYLGIVERARAAMPDAAVTTDVIVGFPGETESDFVATLDVVRAARFAGAFTFQYSQRPGTPAATLPGQVPPEVVAERYARLVDLQEEMSLAGNREQVGRTVEVLVSAGEGRKDSATARVTGRARDGRLVHVGAGAARPGRLAPQAVLAPMDDLAVRPGDVVETVVTYAAPHHLVADGALLAHRRTAAGDLWGVPAPAAVPVSLGLPRVGVPA